MLATTKQTEFLIKLATERAYALPATPMSKSRASQLISMLLTMPKASIDRPLNLDSDRDMYEALDAERVNEPGMYRLANGDIFKVQKAKGSENLYAKKLTPIMGKRLNENDEIVGWEFIYEKGAMRSLTRGDRLSLADAKAFGIQYGVCCVCGATLKDATSVANGIGPICAGKV